MAGVEICKMRMVGGVPSQLAKWMSGEPTNPKVPRNLSRARRLGANDVWLQNLARVARFAPEPRVVGACLSEVAMEHRGKYPTFAIVAMDSQ